MKFKCEKTTLYNAIKAAASAVAALGVASEQNVLFQLKGKELIVSGNDPKITISTTLTVDGEKDGVACIPAKISSDILQVLVQNSNAGAITFSEEDSGEDKGSILPIVISGGETEFSIHQLPIREGTALEIGSDADAAKLKAKDFIKALRQVIDMASASERRAVLTGILIERGKGAIRVVASDTFRLGICDVEGLALPKGGSESVLVPATSLQKLITLATDTSEITIKLEESQVGFEVGETSLVSQLLPGEFPDYKKLIPTDYPNNLIVNKDEFMGALNRVSVIAKDDMHQLVKATLKKNEIELSAVDKSKGTGIEKVSAELNADEEVAIGFNSRYLQDALKSLEDEKVLITFQDAFKPVLIEGEKTKNFQCLLMPVRLSTGNDSKADDSSDE